MKVGVILGSGRSISTAILLTALQYDRDACVSEWGNWFKPK